MTRWPITMLVSFSLLFFASPNNSRRNTSSDSLQIDAAPYGEVLLSAAENAYNPIPSPDGTKIAYVRTGWGRQVLVPASLANLLADVMVMDPTGRLLTP